MAGKISRKPFVDKNAGSKAKTFNDLDAFDKYARVILNETLEAFAENEGLDIMQEVIREDVYNKYTPKVDKRRGEAGGLLDKNNMTCTVVKRRSGWVVVANYSADWQGRSRSRLKMRRHRKTSKTPEKYRKGSSKWWYEPYYDNLPEFTKAIEKGTAMHGAGPRPFKKDVKERIAERLDETIALTLNARLG